MRLPPDLDQLADRLRRWAREQRDERAELRLPPRQARMLLGELGRLQQSNTRLRRQNQRLRARLLAAGGEALDLGDDRDDGAEQAP